MARQQQLKLGLPAGGASFESFWIGRNAAVVAALEEFSVNADDGQMLLLGPPASGKSHLAQAACRARWQAERQAAYLELGAVPLTDEALAGLTPAGLVAIDGLEKLAADEELPLLRLIDRVRAAGGKLLLASRHWPERLALRAPDLRSRLEWGAMLELKPLDEAALKGLLDQRAQELGVRLPPQAADYLLRRLPREPAALLAALERAYALAVASRRQITLPLLGEALGPLPAHEQVAGHEP